MPPLSGCCFVFRLPLFIMSVSLDIISLFLFWCFLEKFGILSLLFKLSNQRRYLLRFASGVMDMMSWVMLLSRLLNGNCVAASIAHGRSLSV